MRGLGAFTWDHEGGAVITAEGENATSRVEHALRADDKLTESHVRYLMRLYLGLRINVDRVPIAGSRKE